MTDRLYLLFNKRIKIEVVKNVITYTRSLKDKTGHIDENVFRSVMYQRFALSAPHMLSRMFVVASKKDRSPFTVNVEDFSELLLIFLTKDVSIKADFAFNVYDTNNRGFFTKADLRVLLAPMVNGISADEDFENEEELLKYFVDLVCKKIDLDQDNNIARWEFQDLVKRDILMLNFLGPCLPERKHVEAFTKLVTNKPNFEVQAYFRHERGTVLNHPDLSQIRTTMSRLYPFPLELP